MRDLARGRVGPHLNGIEIEVMVDPDGRKIPSFLLIGQNVERSRKVGDPAWIRTKDLQLRRLLLYPLSYGADRRAHARAGSVTAEVDGN